jgi:hypothetical protein
VTEEPDSAVGIATRYGLDSLAIESRWGEIFSTRPDRPWSPPILLYSGYRVPLLGVKRPGRGVNHLPPTSAEVKERVELYMYLPSGPSWAVLGRTLPLTLTLPCMTEGKQNKVLYCCIHLCWFSMGCVTR